MGGGKAMFTLISTAAIVTIGTKITNAKSSVPKSGFFILLPPCYSNSAWGSSSSTAHFPNTVSFGKSCLCPVHQYTLSRSHQPLIYLVFDKAATHRRLHKGIHYCSKKKHRGGAHYYEDQTGCERQRLRHHRRDRYEQGPFHTQDPPLTMIRDLPR